jgi:molybdopterin-synthase adenylyltransferase
MSKHNQRTASDTWFSAQTPILGGEGQEALRRTKVFVAAAGGLGSSVALFLARAGVERICQCDPQLIEADNLNRIFAATRHLGSRKTIAVKELLLYFDRLGSDPGFNYTSLPFPVEHRDALPYLANADFIVACPNSLAARRYLARYAVGNGKTLLNVGFGCSPGDYMTGELSLYRPRQPEMACPACISPTAAEQADIAPDPLFYPPLAILAALTVHVLVAEITNFDRKGDARPNYFFYDGYAHELQGMSVARSLGCAICGSPEAGEVSQAQVSIHHKGERS